MRVTRILALNVAIFLGFLGCAPPMGADAPRDVIASADPAAGEAKRARPGSEGQSLEEMRAESLAAIDRTACAAKGGRIRQEGMLGLWRCTVRFPDAGKVCRDGDDCKGRCIAKNETADRAQNPQPMTGVCEDDDSPFGCYGLIEDGTSQGFICVD